MFRLWSTLVLWRLHPLKGTTRSVREWFSRSARGGRTARRLWLFAITLCSLTTCAALAAAASAVVFRRLWDTWPENVGDVLEDLEGLGPEFDQYLVGWIVALLVAVPTPLILRLVQRRWAIKQALQRRDLCVGCGHELTGLPVDESSELTCPECGRHSPAVEAWGEVVQAASGPGRVFRPATGLVRVFWTRRRVVLVGRVAAALVALAALGYGGWWSVREVRIRMQASIARSERVKLEPLVAELQKEIGDRPDGQPLMSDLIAAIVAEERRLTAQFIDSRKATAAKPEHFFPDPSYVRHFTRQLDAREQESAAASVELMAYLHANGLYEQLDKLATASNWQEVKLQRIDDPPEGDEAGTLGNGRRIARLCLARMHLAIQDDNLEEFAKALRGAVAVANAWAVGPTLIHWIVAVTQQNAIATTLSTFLRSHPAEPWLEVVSTETGVLKMLDLVPLCRREHTLMLDTLAWYFSDPSRVRAGLNSPALDEKLSIHHWFRNVSGPDEPDAPSFRLGSYAENRRGVAALFAYAEHRLRFEPWQRPKGASDLPPSSDLAIVAAWGAWPEQQEYTLDRATLRLRSFRTMLALERHRAATGEYPESLSMVSPPIVPGVAIDPYSGKPLGYRRIDAASDPTGRGYLLWTVGLDGIDNNAHSEAKDRGAALRPRGAGKDVILNGDDW